jgi:AcrR family transcriptional regulator
MIREAKDPEVRRKELIDTAILLFSKKGYDNTTVTEIVKEAGVAQGTFYYYFKSKDEVLDAILERSVDEIEAMMKSLISKKDANAMTKLLGFFNVFYSIFRNREKIYDYLHEESNALLHLKMEKQVYSIITPLFADIVRQGINEGVFNTKYPEEAAISILACIDAQYRERAPNMQAVEAIIYDMRIIEVVFDTIERILGAEPGSILSMFKKWRDIHDKKQ